MYNESMDAAIEQQKGEMILVHARFIGYQAIFCLV